ncbi:MAG: ATP-binding cassette domain-containing protein [Spirochaetes bacterium]|nr:ATP-binding cassette domain-containing protein [Spirochaetota bacterium]
MAILSLNQIHFSINGISLLENINLQMEAGEKVCLLGRNGAGKTTLLKIINEELIPDRGEISYQKGIKISRLTQEIPGQQTGTVFQIVEKDLELQYPEYDRQEVIHQIERIISLMNLDKNQDFNTLSVGLQRRVLLAQALAKDPDLIILDEPTNHLDIDSIKWLERFFQNYQGAILLVTHDREFLNQIATRILFLDRGYLKSYPGDYQKFLQKREEDLANEDNANRVFDKKLADEEAWKKQGLKARRKRNMGRVRALEKMRELRSQRKNLAQNPRLQMQEIEKSGRLVLEAKNIHFHYQIDEPIIQDFTTTIMRGDKVGIIGPNGCGKSTLLKILLNQLPPQQGTIRKGTQLQIAYFDQSRIQLDDNLTLQENISGSNDKVIFNQQPRHIISYLEDFLFLPQQIKNPVSSLSGGEKNRLLLAKMFAQPANLLVLDEPTNDLDIETLELLEELLINFSGTVFLITHDRSFLNNVATDVIVFQGNGKLQRFFGGYDDAYEPENKKRQRKAKSERIKNRTSKGLTFKEKQELQQIPLQIEKLEEEQHHLHTNMEDPQFYKQDQDKIKEQQSRLLSIEEELPLLYQRWEELEAKNERS